MVLGGQPTPFFFFTTEFMKAISSLLVVNDNEIVRNASDVVEGKSGLICLANDFLQRTLMFQDIFYL